MKNKKREVYRIFEKKERGAEWEKIVISLIARRRYEYGALKIIERKRSERKLFPSEIEKMCEKKNIKKH